MVRQHSVQVLGYEFASTPVKCREIRYPYDAGDSRSYRPYRYNNIVNTPQSRLTDVNGDGRDDILGLAATADGKTSIVTWKSNGSTAGGGNPGTSGAKYASMRTTVGDFNGDGTADLIAALPAGNLTTLKVNLGIKAPNATTVGFSGFQTVATTRGKPDRLAGR
jgi:hypothetical protein